MKKLKSIIAIALLTITSALFVNCGGSDDDNNTNNNDTTFYLKCKVNGVQFTSTAPFVINSLSKSITAVNDVTNETVSLYLPLAVANGTYTITDEPSNVDSYNGSYTNFDTDASSDNETGTITITQVDADVIKGTFSFTGEDGNGGTIIVTEGQFRGENIQ
jgi:major membrane immunogen (membrane-anchored lipoprotein)